MTDNFAELTPKPEPKAFKTPTTLDELSDQLSGDMSLAWNNIGIKASTDELVRIFDDLTLLFKDEDDESAIEDCDVVSFHLSKMADDPSKLTAFLEKFNLPVRSVLADWNLSNIESADSARRKKTVNDYWKINLGKVIEIELRRPGIASFLHEKYRISDFGRYPTEVLIDQYDGRYDSTSPYGIAIFAKEDKTGAIYDTTYLYSFFKDLKKSGYRFRIFECSDRREVVSALNSSRHQFGKIHFGLIDAHGSETRIALGKYSQFMDDKNIRLEDLVNPNYPDVTKAFIDNPTIILNSCLTGAEGGIKQYIEALGAKVYAPSTSTNITSIEFDPERKEEPFIVEFHEIKNTRE